MKSKVVQCEKRPYKNIILFIFRRNKMNYVYTFITCFLIIYIVYFLMIVNRRKGLEKFKEGTQAEFFKKVYKLDFRKTSAKKFANALAITNALIMAATITIIEIFESMIIKLIVGFIVIIPLMLLSYKILGESFKKKEGK